ncbi:hypothetical protein NDU88_003746 [Pleurodeles waltl]|uniref:Uncharacterized protein n=1 Tax=Pleurodeles waltl TaxID=8319 RepID=A0AAV7UZX2_PLEWA|nr:hypothetical protein NDU88_003746 [Pleurodeles waltl]
MENVANEYGADITQRKKLRKNARMTMAEKELQLLKLRRVRTYVRELIENIKEWSDVEKLKELWSTKVKVKVTQKGEGPKEDEAGKWEETVKEFPLHERARNEEEEAEPISTNTLRRLGFEVTEASEDLGDKTESPQSSSEEPNSELEINEKAVVPATTVIPTNGLRIHIQRNSENSWKAELNLPQQIPQRVEPGAGPTSENQSVSSEPAISSTSKGSGNSNPEETVYPQQKTRDDQGI